jgi:hypothetical protein
MGAVVKNFDAFWTNYQRRTIARHLRTAGCVSGSADDDDASSMQCDVMSGVNLREKFSHPGFHPSV